MPSSASTTSDRPLLQRRCATYVAAAATALAPLVAVQLTAEAAARPAVRWSDTSVKAGAGAGATVRPRSLPAGTSAVLQRKFPDGWRVADATAVRTDAGLRLRVPTAQYGALTYRVAAVKGSRVVSASDTQRVRVRPTYDPRGRKRHYQLLSSQRTRWQSCRPVRWTFNDSRAPRQGLEQVRAAIRRIHAATGLEFDFVGRTTQKVNPWGDDIDGAAVAIGWRPARTFRHLVNSTQVVGLAGQRSVSGYRDAQGALFRTTQGGVILNAGHRLDRGFGEGTTWGEVIVHELGHVMGLGHVGSRKQVMYYSTTGYDANLGAGDLNGLRRLGDTRGCLRRTAGRATTISDLSR